MLVAEEGMHGRHAEKHIYICFMPVPAPQFFYTVKVHVCPMSPPKVFYMSSVFAQAVFSFLVAHTATLFLLCMPGKASRSLFEFHQNHVSHMVYSKAASSSACLFTAHPAGVLPSSFLLSFSGYRQAWHADRAESLSLPGREGRGITGKEMPLSLSWGKIWRKRNRHIEGNVPCCLRRHVKHHSGGGVAGVVQVQ